MKTVQSFLFRLLSRRDNHRDVVAFKFWCLFNIEFSRQHFCYLSKYLHPEFWPHDLSASEKHRYLCLIASIQETSDIPYLQSQKQPLAYWWLFDLDRHLKPEFPRYLIHLGNYQQWL